MTEDDKKDWIDLIHYKKQSLFGKVFIILGISSFGAFIFYIFFNLFSGSGWQPHFFLLLFGWLFFFVFVYIISKVIGVLIHRNKLEIAKLERKIDDIEN